MAEFRGPTEAKNALLDFLYDREEAVPDDVREPLLENLRLPSPVRSVKDSLEIVYFMKDNCGPLLREWAAATAVMCEDNGFVPYGEDSLGSKMAADLREISSQ